MSTISFKKVEPSLNAWRSWLLAHQCHDGFMFSVGLDVRRFPDVRDAARVEAFVCETIAAQQRKTEFRFLGWKARGSTYEFAWAGFLCTQSFEPSALQIVTDVAGAPGVFLLSISRASTSLLLAATGESDSADFADISRTPILIRRAATNFDMWQAGSLKRMQKPKCVEVVDQISRDVAERPARGTFRSSADTAAVC